MAKIPYRRAPPQPDCLVAPNGAVAVTALLAAFDFFMRLGPMFPALAEHLPRRHRPSTGN